MEDLNKAVSLVFAIFHIDLGEFAILFDVIFEEFVSSSLLLIMYTSVLYSDFSHVFSFAQKTCRYAYCITLYHSYYTRAKHELQC